MPFSLNLPYAICYPMTRLARSLSRCEAAKSYDQNAYFEYQFQSTERMQRRFMTDFAFKGAVVLDLGCGLGGRAPYWLQHGAKRVLCVDINRQELAAGQAILAARFPDLRHRVAFLHPEDMDAQERADVSIVFDVFEHLRDPAQVLLDAYDWLKPGGKMWIGSIGWYNYMASHCHSHIPIYWSQLIFSQAAMIRTIRKVIRGKDYTPNVWEMLEGLNRWDHVTRLNDRPGEPLNLLSLSAVRKILDSSPYTVTQFRVHGFSGGRNPIARLFSALARVPLLKEVFHSYYTAILQKSFDATSNQTEPIAPRSAAGIGIPALAAEHV